MSWAEGCKAERSWDTGWEEQLLSFLSARGGLRSCTRRGLAEGVKRNGGKAVSWYGPRSQCALRACDSEV